MPFDLRVPAVFKRKPKPAPPGFENRQRITLLSKPTSHVPAVSGAVLPDLKWDPTTACSPRHGHPVELVVVHRWGVRYTTEPVEAVSYQGVIDWFKNRANQASAHIVYPGSAVPGEATQMVAWSDLAWAEAAYNPVADEIESADAIWLGADPDGLAQLARIVAFRLHIRGLPPVWSTRRGFCRHGDLGSAGGGHTQCPTTDLKLWRHFVSLVEHEALRGGFRPSWGR